MAAQRKPSVAAWAVNQLVRTQGRKVNELFEAGDAVQRAQAELLKGRGEGDRLRAALAQERQAVAELAELARGLLSSDGQELRPATLELVTDSLHAAALDREARRQVAGGTLRRELRHVGLGESPTGASTKAPPKAQRKKQVKPADADHKARRSAEAAERRAAKRAAKDLEKAQRNRDHAAEALAAAEEALAAAEREFRRASRA